MPTKPSDAARSLDRLIELVARLRAPDGCPWDREQTFHSLLPHTVEEAYEVVEAVENGDLPGLRQELGDLLFHVVLYSQIASEGLAAPVQTPLPPGTPSAADDRASPSCAEHRNQQTGHFGLQQVIEGVTGKMIRRHPHLFGPEKEKFAREVARNGVSRVKDNWEEIKRREKAQSGARQGAAAAESVFDGLSSKQPALHFAWKVQQKMNRARFDWTEPEPVFGKVREELDELQAAHRAGDMTAIEEETGDLLFTLVNLARHLAVNPERALRGSTLKFQDRFRYIERRIREEGKTLEETSVARMEELWEACKAEERRSREA